MAAKRWVAFAVATLAAAAVIVGMGGIAYRATLDEGRHDATVPAVVTGCPTEDSCRIDYSGGAWHITPDVP